MKLVRLDEITGEEILARSIMTDDYKELLAEGTQLKTEYIPKLRDIGISEVFIKDNRIQAEDIKILKEEVINKCREQVKKIISRHTFNHEDDSMVKISETADSIIENILEEEEIAQHIFDIKERSADIYEHSISTCSLATLVALKLNLTKEQAKSIGAGCLLHDIGLRYITVPFSNISMESLPAKDVEEYRKHTVYGYSAVKNENWLNKDSKEIILFHHERCDGSGYPLHAKELSVGVKIVAVCDFFDESICGIGSKRMKVHEVVEYLKGYKGVRFDTRVVDALLEFVAVYPSNSSVITNKGDYAVVIKQNKGFPERPVLQLVSDKDGKKYEEPQVIDLLDNNNVFIEKVID